MGSFSSLRRKGLLPDTSTILSWVILLCGSLLLGITTLHWGGAYNDMAVYLFPLGALIWICLGIKAWQNQFQHERLGGWIEIAVLLFLVYALYSYHLSPSKYPARFEFLWILTYAGLFLGLRLGLHNRRWSLGLLYLILILASITCVYALMNKGVHQHLIWGLPRPDYGDRISGTFGCPNHFANLMVMASCIAVALFIYPRTPWALRIVCLYLMAMFAVGLFFSVSRGGYLAWLAGLFAISCFFILQRSFPLKLRVILLGCCLLLAGGATYTAFQNPFVKSRIDATWSGDIRLQLASDALKIWQSNPVFGTGMATFDYTHQRVNATHITTRAVYTHNDYLNLLADYGAIGGVLVLFFFILVMLSMLRRHITSEREFDLMATRAAIWVLVIMGVHSLFDFNFHIPACALTFFTVMAVATSSSRRPSEVSPTSFLPGFLIGLLALASALYLILTPLRIHESTRIEKWNEEKILGFNPLELENLGNKIHAKDPFAGPVMEKLGDALRVKTAEINQAYKNSLRSGNREEASRLLKEREKWGQVSLKFYQRAFEANPLYDSIMIKQGLILDIMDRSQEAYLSYAKALEKQPDNNFFQYHLGFHLLKVGEFDLAKGYFASAKRVHSHRGLDREQRAAAEKALKILAEIEKAGR